MKPGELDRLRYDERTGLVPAVVQHAVTGRVLMLGHMSAEALARTRESGRVVFYSRSRERLWTKGETSGNWLELVEIRADCDADALLITAIPHGPTCHTGAPSCFGAPESPIAATVLAELAELIERRRLERPQNSYTVRLLDAGTPEIVRKVGEEALELCIEALSDGSAVDAEAADLLYHVWVLLADRGLELRAVARVLHERRRHRPDEG